MASTTDAATLSPLTAARADRGRLAFRAVGKSPLSLAGAGLVVTFILMAARPGGLGAGDRGRVSGRSGAVSKTSISG